MVSKNKVRSLKFFEENKNLRELYVRKNEIDDISELVYLQGLRSLTVLPFPSHPRLPHLFGEWFRGYVPGMMF